MKEEAAMRAMVVYESMFGNTRRVAEVIANAMRGVMEVQLLRADTARDVGLDGTDLLVVGAPTHAWGMPRPGTRKGAPNYVRKPGSDLVLEPDADSRPGVREWLDTIGDAHVQGAAFDTRFSGPAALTGRASTGIVKSLTGHGLIMVVAPASFLVDRKNHLRAGEVDRARAWGLQLGSAAMRRGKMEL
jgi:hypothetical protein